MAVCFSLTKRGKTEPVSLNQLDEDVCKMLNKPCDPDKFCRGWYDIIGFRLALGKEWSEIVELFLPVEDAYDLDMLAICAYLQANYTSNCWSSR